MTSSNSSNPTLAFSLGGTINLKKNTYKSFEGACFEIKLPLKES